MTYFNTTKDEENLNKMIDDIIKEHYRLTKEDEETLLEHTSIIQKILVPKSENLTFAKNQLQEAINLKAQVDEELISNGIEFINNDLYCEDIGIYLKSVPVNCPLYIRNQDNKLPYISMPFLSKIYKNLLYDIDVLNSQVKIMAKGENGENIANKYFSLFSDKYPIRKNIIIPIEDAFAKSSEIDTYIVTPKGLFVCEIKNWGNENEKIIIENDGKWFKSSNKDKVAVSSPVEQNTRHCLATEKYLKINGIECKTIPIVVIANTKTILENHSCNTVLRVSDVYNYIENLNLPNILSEEDTKNILNILDSCECSEKKFLCYDFESQERYYDIYFNKAFEIFKCEMNIKRICANIAKEHVEMLVKRGKKIKIIACILFILLALIIVVKNITFIKFMIGLTILGFICGSKN